MTSKTYYARIKIRGKTIRESLHTNVFTTAKLRLVDFLKDKRDDRAAGDEPMFAAAVELYRARVAADSSMKESSKGYRELCISKIQDSWPDLRDCRLSEITPESCRAWAARLRSNIASQYFNNVIGTLRLIIDEGIKAWVRAGNKTLENPAKDLARAKIAAKVLALPEPGQFRALVELMRKANSWGPKAADLVEFLAYSGTRIFTEARWITWDDVDWERREIIVRGHPETHTKNWEVRRIPILPDMDALLRRMQTEAASDGPPKGRILKITECPISLHKACRDLGIPRLRHHDLRHLFATRCIESGVDIPTVARWLGHKDGGALAMRVYGHLRNQHSQEMAKKVKF